MDLIATLGVCATLAGALTSAARALEDGGADRAPLSAVELAELATNRHLKSSLHGVDAFPEIAQLALEAPGAFRKVTSDLHSRSVDSIIRIHLQSVIDQTLSSHGAHNYNVTR